MATNIGDQYGEGWSLARGLANTPGCIWGMVAVLFSAGVVCLHFGGYVKLY